MPRRFYPILGLLVPFVILIGSCRPGPEPTPTESPATIEPPRPTRTPTSTPTPTETPEPSSTPTPAPHLQVSENTNCRTGPGPAYLFQGVLKVGETARVIAQATEPGYWFVTGADLPDVGCWVLGDFAEVDGNASVLPVFTAAPSPTPEIGFRVYLQGFEKCSKTFYVVFAVKNVGGKRIWSGYVQVENYSTHDTLYSARERHPFADTVLPVCPPGHGNELWPGETRYIHAPLSDVKSGSIAVATITLCTADHQGGTCLTEYSYFELP